MSNPYHAGTSAYFEADCRSCGHHIAQEFTRGQVGGNHAGVRVRCHECGATNWCAHTIQEVDSA